MGLEKCANCECNIGKLEIPCVYKGSIVCSSCHTILTQSLASQKFKSSSSNLSPEITDVRIVQPKSVVGITLTVIATIIGVFIVLGIVAGFFDYLVFHFQQFKATGDW